MTVRYEYILLVNYVKIVKELRKKLNGVVGLYSKN